MESKIILGFMLLISGINSEDAKTSRQFPDGFLFGTATASFQIEGAWDVDGKSESVWDRFTHTHPELVVDGTNADVACDSYHQVERDVAMLKELGVNFYRFSLAWTRILPSPLSTRVNRHGINYYNKLIDLLLQKGIQPMVTIFHWDLPQQLQDFGGFTNDLVLEPFVRYASVVFETFGDRVKLWTTFNQPFVYCHVGYGTVLLAPADNASGVADYQCHYNVLKAHAAVYHLYNNTFKSKQNGKISINIDSLWYEPSTQTKEDIDAANRAMQFHLGFLSDPIFSEKGDFPELVRRQIETRSLQEGFPKSRLPEFTEEEIKYIRGTHDYFCINHYSTYLVADKQPEPIGAFSYDFDVNVKKYFDPSWTNTAHNRKKVVPWGLRKLLKWIKDHYGDPEIYITENGTGDSGGKMDHSRVRYLKLYLDAVLDAIFEDGVRVKGYTVWSLMDNYEWTSGYSVRYGLYHVDFSSPNRTRSPKLSAQFFKELMVTRSLEQLE